MATKTTKGIIGIVAVAIIILAAVLIFKSRDTGEIKIGSIMPLSGDAAAYGLPLQKSAILAIEEINSQGGILGKQIKIIFEDGKCTGKEASSAAQKLINVDGVKVILGGLCSGETLGAAPIAESSKVILFSPGSGSPDITNAGDYVFRNFPSDASSGSKIAESAIEQGYVKVGVLSEVTDYAQAVSRVFKNKFKSLGGVISTDESFSSDASDFKTQITKIINAKPDAVYIVPQTPSKFGLVLKQLKELGYEGPLYTNEIAAGKDVLEQYKNEIDGAILAEPLFNPDDPISKEFLDKLTARYGELAGALPPVYLATTYDAVYILKEAIESCGEVKADCIKTHLYSIKNRKGTAGLLTLDPNGDPLFNYVLKVVKDGKVNEYKQ